MGRPRITIVTPPAVPGGQADGATPALTSQTGVAAPHSGKQCEIVTAQERRRMDAMYEEYRLSEDKAHHLYDMLRLVSHPLQGEHEEIDAALAAIGHREGNILSFEELIAYATATKAQAIAEVGRTRMSSRQQTTLEAFVMLGGAPDGTGYIMLDNLISTLQSFKLTVNVVALSEVLDKDGNGQVDFEEFSWFYNEALAGNALSAVQDPTPTLRHESTKNFSSEMSIQSSTVTEASSPLGLTARVKKLQSEKQKKKKKSDIGDSLLGEGGAEEDNDDEDEEDGSSSDFSLQCLAATDTKPFSADEVMRRLYAALQHHNEAFNHRRGITPNNARGDATPLLQDLSGSVQRGCGGGGDSPRLSAVAQPLPLRPAGSAPTSRSTPRSCDRVLPKAPSQPGTRVGQRPASAATTPRMEQLSHDALTALTTKKKQTDERVVALKKELQRRMDAVQSAIAELDVAQKEQEELHELVIGEMRRLRRHPRTIVMTSAQPTRVALEAAVAAAERKPPAPPPHRNEAKAVTASDPAAASEKGSIQSKANDRSTPVHDAEDYSDSFASSPSSAEQTPARSNSSARSSSTRSQSSTSSRHSRRSASTSTRHSSSAASSAAKPSKAAAPAAKRSSPSRRSGSSPRVLRPTRALRPVPKHIAPVTPRALRLMKNMGKPQPQQSPAGSVRRGRTKEDKEDEILNRLVEEHDAKRREEKSACSGGIAAKSALDPETLKERNPYMELLQAPAAAASRKKQNSTDVADAPGDKKTNPKADSDGKPAVAPEQMKLWTR
jgi:hypothetical protein